MRNRALLTMEIADSVAGTQVKKKIAQPTCQRAKAYQRAETVNATNSVVILYVLCCIRHLSAN